ncbi:MAG: serine/threonine-protein kinase, partial [Pirellulales bacterium]
MASPEPKLREFFSKAVQFQTAQEQAAYLEQACQGDAELRAQLEGLLQAHREAGSFLQEPSGARAATVDAPPVLEQPGAVIGPYKLLQQIGEGGMGAVFMAEQTQPVRRKVALKVIKAGMDSGQVIARFEAERQALALMDHPSIAKVLDAGTTVAGRPYVVMELVKGIPITTYCDENQLPPKARLELFTRVCQAVQHAHQKGVIHRDLKPTNVLVTLYDDKPVPKVIDFGVAKAIGGRLTERTMFTGFGQIVGTLEYMSPEQAQLNALDIDTRGDLYSLGVLLYELLTGATPFDKKRLREAAFDEMLRIIREEEPPKPSTRLSTAEARTSIAVNRGMEANKLSGLLRGELDWIVMKALEKDRNRRYETAKDFATDVERYLADQPVLACPASIGYRLRKFVRRNKGPVLAVALVALALLGGLIGTTWGMIQAEQARGTALSAQFAEAERAQGERRAKEEAQKRLSQIEKGTEILGSVFRDLDPIAAEKAGVTSRDLLCQRLSEAAQQLEGETVGDPLIMARLQHLLGVSLREMDHLDQAEGVLVKACRTRERMLGADHVETAATRHDLAKLYRDQRKLPVAEALFNEVLAIRTARLGADHLDTLATKHHLAVLYRYQKKYALAETLCKEVLASRTARLGADDLDTVATKSSLGALYHVQGKFALAELLYKEVLATRTARLGADHLDTIRSRDSLALLYWSMKKLDQSIPLLEENLELRKAELPPDDPEMLGRQVTLGANYCDAGRFADAIPLLEEAHQKGRKDPERAWVGNALLTAYMRAGKTTEATALATEQVRAARQQFPADSPELAAALAEIGKALLDAKAYGAAEPLYKEVLAIRTAKLGADHADTIRSRDSLALLYWSMKKLDQSIPLLEENLERRKAELDPDDPEMLGRRVTLGANYCDAGRFADGIALIEEVRRKGRADPHPAWVRSVLLTAYVQAGRTTEATALVTERVRDARGEFPADSPELAAALADAGKVLLDAKAYADAERLLLDGYQGLKQTEAKTPPQLKEGRLRDVLERLVQLYDAWGKPDEAAKWRKELEAHQSPAEKSASPYVGAQAFACDWETGPQARGA